MSNSAIQFLLNHISRCDSEAMGCLRTYTNKLITKEASLSLMKSQITFVSHGIDPVTLVERAELFGHHGQKCWDGIHFRGGSAGPKKLFDSISSVIANI